MPNRREFLAQTAVAGILAMAGAPRAVATEKNTAPASEPKGAVLASKPLRILILGGTGFIGSHLVHFALERGHNVSVFSRSRKSAELPSSVEHLIGDRNGHLESIKNRDWDAVIDIATYGPIWVRTLGQALKDRVKHYTFISSVARYDNSGVGNKGTDENTPALKYVGDVDPYTLTRPKGVYQNYGALKALCEREAEKQFPGKALNIRPGAIVGPDDNNNSFTYLCARIEAGGEMLVAGDPLQQMQLIDVRDLTEWMIRLVEKGETGPVNAAGPAMQLTWAEMLGAIRGPSAAAVKLTWVPVSWLTEQKVSPHSNLLNWPMGNGFPGIMRMNNDKARAKGLTFRPIAVSRADTLAWYQNLPPTRQAQILPPFDPLDRQHRSLEYSMARERELLEKWRARNSG